MAATEGQQRLVDAPHLMEVNMSKRMEFSKILLASTLTLSLLVGASSAFAQAAGGGNGGGGGGGAGGGGPDGGGAEITLQMNVPPPIAAAPEYQPIFQPPVPVENCRFLRKQQSGQKCH
jgi:hypothetical protein